nr:hypothetical protein [Caldilineaceae bacterium]
TRTATPSPAATVETPTLAANPQVSARQVVGHLAYQEKHYIPLSGVNPNQPLTVEMVVDPATHPAAGAALNVYIVSSRDWEQIINDGIHPQQAHQEVGRAEGPVGHIRASIGQPSPPHYVVVVNDDQLPANYTLSISNGSFGQ